MQSRANTNTKGQMIGQVFVFILAGLMFVLILTYGYRAVQQFLQRSEQVTLIDFRTDLESAVESVKRDYGSVRKVELRLPTRFQGVCILDPMFCPTDDPVLELPQQQITLGWMRTACETKSANAFLVPRELDLLLPDVTVDPPNRVICLPNVSGKIVLRLEGTGKKAKVSAWV